MLSPLPPTTKWRRIEEDKVIAGVCAGVAESYGISVNTVRWLYTLGACFMLPTMVFLYLFQWLVYPKAEETDNE